MRTAKIGPDLSLSARQILISSKGGRMCKAYTISLFLKEVFFFNHSNSL